jgi:hypothetical protein
MQTELSMQSNTDHAASPESSVESAPSRSISISITLLFSLAVISALYFGWTIRDEYFLSAEQGLGYALGIVGGSMMLLLLIYPLRKRFSRSALFIFSTKNWFKLHMILGVLGPLFILYHCNFGLGSTNSNVALASMLLMVTSGLIGRFIYGKIHYGLYGSKVQLKELQNHRLLMQQQLEADQETHFIKVEEAIHNRLRAFESSVLAPKGFLATLLNVATLGLSTRISYWLLISGLRKGQKQNPRFLELSRAEKKYHLNPVKQHIASYLATIRRIAGLSFYERLFSFWHMLHLPIFFMLIITGLVHVYAVHTY